MVFVVLVAVACAGSDAPTVPPGEQVDPVRVSAGPDSESLLLAHLQAALLRSEDVAAEVVDFTDARDARQALELGRVDVRGGVLGGGMVGDDGPRRPARRSAGERGRGT